MREEVIEITEEVGVTEVEEEDITEIFRLPPAVVGIPGLGKKSEGCTRYPAFFISGI